MLDVDTAGGKMMEMVGKVKGQRGRPQVKGAALPKMSVVLDDPNTMVDCEGTLV